MCIMGKPFHSHYNAKTRQGETKANNTTLLISNVLKGILLLLSIKYLECSFTSFLKEQ